MNTTTEIGMELGSCLADSCPNLDRRLLVGERISHKAIAECCDVGACIMTGSETTSIIDAPGVVYILGTNPPEYIEGDA